MIPPSEAPSTTSTSVAQEAPQTSDFRLELQNELVRRCKMNPRYSLRAFAKFLGVEPSFLSKLLNGKRAITPASLKRLAPRLGLNPDQFAPSSAQKIGIARTFNYPAPSTRTEFKQLSHDTFQMIADWYHYAILELVTLKNFQPSNKWISRSLGISIHELTNAVERLVRLGFLKIDETLGTWSNTTPNVTTIGNNFSSVALRQMQSQILNGALRALEEIPMERRDQSSITMAIDSRLLPEAKERINRFRRELINFLQSNAETRDHVYQLAVSLYPVTHDLESSYHTGLSDETISKAETA